MIAWLKGIILLIDSPYIIVEVGGVGYKVLLSTKILSSLKTNDKIQLFTYTHVREDALDLFGFLTFQDLKLFEKLIGVSGVGPKTAIGIFTLGSSTEITNAILNGDISFFEGVSRLGRKNAQKIIIELKGKLNLDAEISGISPDGVKNQDVVNALTQFGFSQKEAREAISVVSVKQSSSKGELKTEEKIRLALKYLGK